MKKYLLIVLVMILAAKSTAFAMAFSGVKGFAGEKVVLFTDRSLYIAGEQINFKASVFSDSNSNGSGPVHILYCELVTPDGKKVVGNKYPVSQLEAEGCIFIPKDLITGTYYLRAYTRMMLNYGPASFGYRQIRIINPGKNEVLVSEKNQDAGGLLTEPSAAESPDELYKVSADKKVYVPRDTISVTVQQGKNYKAGIKSLCLSVVPDGTKEVALLQPLTSDEDKYSKDYYPESRGLSLTGKLTEANSSLPVQGKRVNLSIMGSGRDFMSVRTDTSGRFYFALPDYYGSRDIFLCAEKTPAPGVKIWVDNEFYNSAFHLPTPDFALTEQEREIVLNMANNIQISNYFQNKEKEDTLADRKSEIAFYGKPTTIIELDKYILLPTLEEYFNELSSQVRVRRHKGEPGFVVLGSADISFYEPLVMVDWVAVDEPSKILAVSPQNISRIEIVNEDYVKGGQTYGGIISLISKKGDFAGIDLPSAGMFINYGFLAEQKCRDIQAEAVAAHPDTRNTLLWKPGIEISGTKPEKLIFTAPDTPGKYIVVIEGVTKDGHVFSETGMFEVKN